MDQADAYYAPQLWPEVATGLHGDLAQISEDAPFTHIECACDLGDGESELSDLTCAGWFCFGGSLLPAGIDSSSLGH